MFNNEDFDTTVRPQDNFFQFVNGGWLKNNPIPPYESKWGTFLKLREDNWQKLHLILEELLQEKVEKLNPLEIKLRDFYFSAIDPEKPEKTGKEILDSWLQKISSAKNISELFSYIYELQSFGFAVPWLQYVDIDDKNSEAYVFRLRQSGLGLPDRDYYFKDDKAMENIRMEYKLHIPRMFMEARQKTDPGFEENIFSIERSLAEYSMTTTEQRDIERQYNKMSIDDLRRLAPSLNWDEYFSAIKCPVQNELIIDQPKFFENLEILIKTKSLESWKNYFSWHLIKLFAKFLGEKFEEKNFAFYGKVINGAQTLQPRWKRVVMQMDEAIGDGLGQKFVEKYFPKEAKERMQILVKDLKDAFSNRIEKLEWMTRESKSYAQKKLSALNLKIGYPAKWVDYSDMKVTPYSFLENILEASSFDLTRQINKLGKPIDKEEWLMTPQTVNAYAYYNLNEIVFPAGILQSPFFSLEADDAENYGGIGSVIGHEITHGFDDKGSQFDAEGNFRNWRKPEDEANFNERAKVLEKQGNAFVVLPGLNLNGKLTLGENIADLGGIEMALDAFEKSLSRNPLEKADGYTPSQRFFLSFARSESESVREEKLRNIILTDPHSPPLFRSNGVLKNVDRFYEEFNVKPGDGMYIAPESRVKIW